MSGIFHRNIALTLVSIAVIPIMASQNAPGLSTKVRSIRRPRPNTPRMEAVVVEAEMDAEVEVALLVEAMVMVVIEPHPRQVEGR